jgi:hypothetical protein
MSSSDRPTQSTASATRRKVLTGMLSASAVVALAPANWTKPMFNRMITPAHGQAISIAAGTYRFTTPEVFPSVGGVGSTCEIEVFYEFDWPGGSGPHTISYRLVDVTPIGSGSCDPDDIDTLISLIESLQFIVQVVSDVGTGLFPLPATTPALPSGFFFVIAIPD